MKKILSLFILLFFAHAIVAEASQLEKSQAGYYRMKVGSINVTPLSDGTIPLDLFWLLKKTKPAEIKKLLARSFETSPANASVISYLIELDKRIILVDTGAGELLGPTLNKLPQSLKAVGVTPEAVTDILITHIHTDHSGGLVIAGKKMFPNATIHVEKKELDYWVTNEENKNKAPTEAKKYFEEAASMMKPYLATNQVKTFDGATELFPGLSTVPAPGHTPGHTYYSLEDQGQKIVFMGDIIHAPYIQFAKPSITVKFDVDSEAAGRQRIETFAAAAKEGYLIAPAHMHFPGVGHLNKVGNSYNWVPLIYVDNAQTTQSNK